MVGASLLVLVAVFVGLVIPADPTELSEWVTRFPSIRTARVIENLVYLSALTLEIPLVLGLYRVLHREKPAAALFGSAFCLVGIGLLAASAAPHVAHAKLFEIFNTPGITEADRSAVAIMWQSIWGLFDAILYVGFVLMPAGLLVLGIGITGSTHFTKRLGVLITALSAVGLASGMLQMIDPVSIIGSGSYLSTLLSCLILGWKILRLSKN